MKQIEINAQNCGQRVDKFVMKLLPQMSKSFCYKMFRKKNITLNNHKISGNELLKAGDVIAVYFKEETYLKFSSPEIKQKSLDETTLKEKVDVIFEDEGLLVINKPEGLLSQGDGQSTSLIEWIAAYYESKNIVLPVGVKVSVSNRLDRNTTGVVLSGKTLPVIKALNQSIAEHKVRKLYHAIVIGHLEKVYCIDGYIHKDERTNKVYFTNKNSDQNNNGSKENESIDYIYSTITPINYKDGFTEVAITIKTGKSHQIRVSLAEIGHPVLGDYKYGHKSTNERFKQQYGLMNQLLHAISYQLIEPEGVLSPYSQAFTAPYPKVYKHIRNELFSYDNEPN